MGKSDNKTKKNKKWEDNFEMAPKKFSKKGDKKDRKYKNNKIYSDFTNESFDDFE